MKRTTTTLLFLISFVSLAQEAVQRGSIGGYVYHGKTKAPIGNAQVILERDSLISDTVTTGETGSYRFAHMPEGPYKLTVMKDSFHTYFTYDVVIQKRQVGRYSYNLFPGDSTFSNYRGYDYYAQHSAQAQMANKATHPPRRTNVIASMPGIAKVDSEEWLNSSESDILYDLCIIDYQVPLIDKDASYSQTITRDNIARMPGRSINSIASATTMQHYNMDGSNQLNVRGARTDATAYYIDGVKVRGSTNLPKNAIQSVKTISSGIPANYGDVTGGIVSIITRSYKDGPVYYDYSADSPGRKKKRKNKKGESAQPTPTVAASTTQITASTQVAAAPTQPIIENPYMGGESYEIIYENDFLSPTLNPMSTFSIDVDKASYSNIRRFINSNSLPPKGAVRIEEMVNYFNYDYPEASIEEPVKVHSELAHCPWNEENLLLKVGLKGHEVKASKAPANNLVFLIDVSGSMNSANKLGLLKQAFALLVDNLRARDRVAIVVYAGSSGLVLESTPGSKKQDIKAAIDRLRSGGGTNGSAGIKLAYETALKNYIEDGNNRIILATDGDFNIGISDNNELLELIKSKRDKGVYLTTLGFGTGNYQDDRMEMLADNGNGNYFYIDGIREAKKVFVEELLGTMYVIAKDVKLQLEFDSTHVKEYRLIGYENRLLRDRDFDDDKIDAGEMGSGHTVTALYEITVSDAHNLLENKIQNTGEMRDWELVHLRYRFKYPEADTSVKRIVTVKNAPEEASDEMMFASAVASYGMLLRDSQFKGVTNYQKVISWAEYGLGNDTKGYRGEFLDMVRKSLQLAAN